MITEKDLQEAIAECEGIRNPNANTCIKLAAFYTIREHLFPQGADDNGPTVSAYSYANGTGTAVYESESDFARIMQEISMNDAMPILDELMQTLQVIQPRLYESVMRKLNQ